MGIKAAVRPAVQKRLPADVLRRAIGGHFAHPLALAVRRVAAHPGLHLRDLSCEAFLNPFAGIGERTGTLVLQPDLDHSI